MPAVSHSGAGEESEVCISISTSVPVPSALALLCFIISSICSCDICAADHCQTSCAGSGPEALRHHAAWSEHASSLASSLPVWAATSCLAA